MKFLRQLLNRPARPSASRFDRYYTGLLQAGSGYPTADEARRDLARYDRSMFFSGWSR
jgi:hypothetical protein